jgi:hypothetical protein
MANTFTITTAADKLQADNGGRATIVFTVTNATARPLRGIAKVKPLDNTQAGWLTIEGETERDFPAGGTHQFTVVFNKPKSTSATAAPTAAPQSEKYRFRFDAISANNPDEDFTEGPVVTVEASGQKVAPPKPFPWWILILVAVLLIVGGIIAFLLVRNKGGEPLPPPPTPTPVVTPTAPPPEKVEVANVVGKTFAEAEKELANQKLKAEKVSVSAPDKEADKVFQQEPVAVKLVDIGSVVKLSVPDTCNIDSKQCIWFAKFLLHSPNGTADGNGWSIAPGTPVVGHFIFGPYFSLQDYGPGEYTVFWYMKVDDNSKDVNAAIVDIYTHQPNPTAYKTKVIKANEFPGPGAYQQFTLDFRVIDPTLKYEFRVAYAGNVKLTVEKIGFQKK